MERPPERSGYAQKQGGWGPALGRSWDGDRVFRGKGVRAWAGLGEAR